MRYPCDFIDGPVTRRLLAVLRDRDAKAITTLMKEGKFRVFRNTENVISSKTLLPAYIADYVEDSGYSLHDVFYGFGTPVKTNFTQHDNMVLYYINQLSQERAERLYQLMQQLYPNSFYDIGWDLRPSQKLRECFLRLPRGSLSKGNKSFQTPGIGHLSEEAQTDIQHYCRLHFVPSYVFDSNCMPEYAEFLGISLHWLWSLPVPLYTKSQTGDLVFDFYTLMQPKDQLEFVHFILYYIEEQQRTIADLYQKFGGI